jgi:hypothetical protein
MRKSPKRLEKSEDKDAEFCISSNKYFSVRPSGSEDNDPEFCVISTENLSLRPFKSEDENPKFCEISSEDLSVRPSGSEDKDPEFCIISNDYFTVRPTGSEVEDPEIFVMSPEGPSMRPFRSGDTDPELWVLHEETSVEGIPFSTECRRAKVGPKVEIEVRIGIFKVNALMDCGAELSAINSKYYEMLGNAIHRVYMVPVFRINTASGCVYVDKRVECRVKFNLKEFLWKFYVISELKRSMVLVTDWMYVHKKEMMQILVDKFDVKRLSAGPNRPSK